MALTGLVLIFGSSVLPWVNVELDTEALTELAEGAADGALGEAVDGAVDRAVDGDIDTAELLEDGGEAIEAARDLIPDLLLDATLNGQNAFDLFGFGFLLVGLAVAGALAGAVWAIQGTQWLRWIAVLCALALLVVTIAVPLSIVATDAALETFLPEDWKPFSPSFDLTTAPLGAIGGAVIILLGLVGRSPTTATQSAPSEFHSPSI